MGIDARPLLSRVADSLYWMARYMERAENVARLMEVNLHLQLDLPLDGNQWQPLIEACGEAPVFRKRFGEATQESVIAFLAQDREYANSIYSCLLSARENARSVRETISSEMFEHVNGVYLRVQSQYARPSISTALMLDVVMNSDPSFRRFLHSPRHAPDCFSSAMTSPTILAFSSGG